MTIEYIEDYMPFDDDSSNEGVPDDYDSFMQEGHAPQGDELTPNTPEMWARMISQIKDNDDEEERRKYYHSLGGDLQELAKECGMLGGSKTDSYVRLNDGLYQSSLVQFGLEVSRGAQFPMGTTVLTGMACFSAVASMCYCTEFQDGSRVPIGLYLCAGQPSGASKSRVMSMFLSEFQKGISRIRSNAIAENDKRGKGEDKVSVPSSIFSNATPEAIELSMSHANSGRFIVASSEQGAIDKILNIGVKDRSVDNDLILKGFVGEMHSSARVTRGEYSGEVFGTVILLSQPETSMKVVSNSNGQGVAERFLFSNEPSLLGSRQPRVEPISKDLKEHYNKRVKSILERYKRIEPSFLDDLKSLKFCKEGWDIIYDAKSISEPMIGQYSRRGEHMLASALSKIDQHIMKISVILHIYESLTKGGDVPDIVDKKWVACSLRFSFEMHRKLASLLMEQGEVGAEAKYDLITEKIQGKSNVLKSSITGSLKNNKLFGSRKAVSETIEEMLLAGLLIKRGKFILISH